MSPPSRRPARGAQPAVTNAFAELAFAALAHLPPPSARAGSAAAAASMADPRWLAWAGAGALPAPVREELGRDAATVAVLLADAGAEAVLSVHALPALHHDLESFETAGRDELASLEPGRVADAGVLRLLQGVPAAPLELLRCAMLLAAPAWRTAWPAVRDELDAASAACESSFAAAGALSPRLAAQEVELAHALGFRGRAVAGRIWVGAPLPWNDHGPDDAAMWALHEVAVVAAAAAGAQAGDDSALQPQDAASRWRSDEAVAIRAVAELVAGTAVASAHARWLGRLSLHALPEPSTSQVSRTVAALRA
jgi:hypothetical protein